MLQTLQQLLQQAKQNVQHITTKTATQKMQVHSALSL